MCGESRKHGFGWEGCCSNAHLDPTLLIDQTRIHVDQFSKTGKKQWTLREYDEEDEAIALVTVPFEITLQDLYNKVKFEPVEFEGESADVEELG